MLLSQVILDVVKGRQPTPFVAQWISRYIPDIEKWRAFIPDSQYSPNETSVNELLNQFFSNSAFPARYLVKTGCMIFLSVGLSELFLVSIWQPSELGWTLHERTKRNAWSHEGLPVWRQSCPSWSITGRETPPFPCCRIFPRFPQAIELFSRSL